MELELKILWAALIFYTIGGVISIVKVVLGKRPEGVVLGLLIIGFILQTISIGHRWDRLGHGPFITLFEILTSNLWSMMFAFIIAYWKIPKIRTASAVIMPILFIMMLWLIVSHPGEGFFPPTYRTPWLFVHIGMGKVFMGAMVVALGLSVVILMRKANLWTSRFEKLPNDKSLDNLIARCLGIGLIFDALMLITGAIWAQDAWGRYWAWDPLETWSLVSWILMAMALHMKYVFKQSPQRNAAMVVLIFVVSFLTFFGIPFITTAPHQGAV